MSKVLEVIFKKEKKGIFKLGQRKFVKLGYAINYLIPQGYAEIISKDTQPTVQKIEKEAASHNKNLKALALGIKDKLTDQSVVLTYNVHDEDQLYGSVTPKDIAKTLNEKFALNLDRFDIGLTQPIKTLGQYMIDIVVHDEVPIQVKFEIQAEPKEEKKTKEKNKKPKE